MIFNRITTNWAVTFNDTRVSVLRFNLKTFIIFFTRRDTHFKRQQNMFRERGLTNKKSFFVFFSNRFSDESPVLFEERDNNTSSIQFKQFYISVCGGRFFSNQSNLYSSVIDRDFYILVYFFFFKFFRPFITYFSGLH